MPQTSPQTNLTLKPPLKYQSCFKTTQISFKITRNKIFPQKSNYLRTALNSGRNSSSVGFGKEGKVQPTKRNNKGSANFYKLDFRLFIIN